MHFTCSFLLKILKRVTPKVYLLQIVAVLETCREQLAISHRILQQGFGLQYMKDNLRKELKTFTILPLVFQRGMEKINVLFVWVLYKLQFKVKWKHTLWNLSLLVVTLLDLTMNLAGFLPIWNPILKLQRKINDKNVSGKLRLLILISVIGKM